MKKKALAGALAMILLLCGCAAPAGQKPTAKPLNPGESQSADAMGVARLSVMDVQQKARPAQEMDDAGYEKYDAFLQKLRSFSFETAQKLGKDNVVYSPLSLYLATSCLARGASGQTEADMEKALYPDEMSAADAAECCARLLAMLEENKQDTIDIHTLVTVSEKYKLSREFAQTAIDSYNGWTATADFSSSEAKDALNAWIEEKTRGMIRDMIGDEVNADTAMVLLNSVYFLGKWVDEFDPADTKKQTFHGKAGDTETDMMQRKGEMPYGEDDVMQAVRLDYKGGAHMNVYLPKEGRTTGDVLAALTAQATQRGGYGILGRGDGTLRLPKFTAEANIDLEALIEDLGMGSMMAGGLTDITEGGEELYVSAAQQKAKIIVDEKGTEAAAVTEYAAEATGILEPPVPFEMTVDRPFVYTIEWGSVVLFVGIVNDLG